MFKPDVFSLLAGLVIGILVVILVTRPFFRKIISGLLKRRVRKIDSSLSVEVQFRKQLLRYLESLHLVPFFCRLSDLYIPQTLISNPLYLDINSNIDDIPGVFLNPPNLNAIPGLAGSYPFPEISLSDALLGGCNLLIKGRIGSGKTTALAYLSIEILEHRCKNPDLNNYLPLYIHIRDLDLSQDDISLIQWLVQGFNFRFPNLKKSDIEFIITKYQLQNHLLLMIDGLDELSPSEFNLAVKQIARFSKANGSIRLCTTSGPYYSGGLVRSGFIPLYMKPPAPQDYDKLCKRLVDLFFVSKANLYPFVLNNWIKQSTQYPDYFSATIGVVSMIDRLFSYDKDIIQSYVKLCTNDVVCSSDLIRIAECLSNDNEFSAISETIEKWLTDPPYSLNTLSISNQSADAVISALVENHILIANLDGKLRFSNPELMGRLLSQSSYYARIHDLGVLAEFPIATRITQLSNEKGYIASWLHTEKIEQPQTIFIALDHLISKNDKKLDITQISEIIAGHIISASLPLNQRLLFSFLLYYTQPNIFNYLVKHIIKLPDKDSKSLIAFFAGKPEVVLPAEFFNINLLASENKEFSRILKFSVIQNQAKEAFYLIDNGMKELMGHETAELLAMSDKFGQGSLIDYSHHENPNARRNACFGFRLINEPWAQAALDNLNKTDTSWMVRDAAAQAMENLWNPRIFVPRALCSIEENPDVISFCAENNIRITKDKLSTEIIEKLMATNNYRYQLLAIKYLFSNPSSEGMRYLKSYTTQENPLREIASFALQQLVDDFSESSR